MSLDFERDIVGAAYEGVLKKPYWTKLLKNIRVATGADYVSFCFPRPGDPVRSSRIIYSTEGDPDLKLDVVDDIFRHISLRDYPHYRIGENQVCPLHDMLDADNDTHNAFRAYLADRSLNHLLMLRVPEPAGGNSLLGIGRHDRDFAPDATALLTRLAPHLGAAVRMLVELEREQMRSRIAADAVRRLNFGWLTLDAHAHVLDADPEAEQLFRATPGLGAIARDKPLRMPRKAQAQLRSTLKEFLAKPLTRPHAIHVLDEPWLDMLVVQTTDHTIAGTATPIAIGYVHGDVTPSSNQCAQLMELYALTYSEARVALAISRGKTLVEAAADMKITPHTARYYSKRIFMKTGSRNQADLVRLILASVLALA